jgi:hypothetical protein
MVSMTLWWRLLECQNGIGQVVHEHDTSRMVGQDTGLDIERSRDVVVMQATSRPRPREQKVAPTGVPAAGEPIRHQRGT